MISVDPFGLCLPRQRWCRIYFWSEGIQSLIRVMNYSKEVIKILKNCNSDRRGGCKMWEETAAHRSATRL